MNGRVVESPGWSRGKWFVYIAMIVLLQVGLIYWLAHGEPKQTTRSITAPGVSLLSSSVAGLSGLMDPTLLPLPNRHGASGRAWLHAPAMQYASASWTGPSGMLALRADKLGGALASLIRTNLSQPLDVSGRPAPGLDGTAFYVQPELAPTQSFFRVEGELAGRPLLNQFKLRSWPMADGVLTNSEVQIVVDESGRVFSPPILVSKSGSDEADTSALELARTARFGALRPRGPKSSADPPLPLAWGKLVFQWQTVPMPPTNGPATGRRP